MERLTDVEKSQEKEIGERAKEYADDMKSPFYELKIDLKMHNGRSRFFGPLNMLVESRAKIQLYDWNVGCSPEKD